MATPKTPATVPRATAATPTTTRQRLVAAAEDLIAEVGDESAVTVRALEARAGVTAPTIYRHFPDMSALLSEIATRQFSRLAETVEAAAAEHTDDPVAALAAMGQAFAQHALSHPGAYRVLFMNRIDSPVDTTQRLRDAAGYHHLVAMTRRAIDIGALPADDDPHELASLLLMSVHGVISMTIARPGGWSNPEHLVERMIHAVGYGVIPRTTR